MPVTPATPKCSKCGHPLLHGNHGICLSCTLELQRAIKRHPAGGQINAKALIKLRKTLADDPLFRPPTTNPTEGGTPNGE